MPISQRRTKTSTTTRLLLVVLAISVGGCTRPMLGKYSSLHRRTASLSHSPTTIRSQDSPWQSPLYQAVESSPPTVSTGSDTVPNAAVNPTARLLAPQFGPASLPPQIIIKPATPEAAPIESASDMAAPSAMHEPASGHSIGFTTDSVRRFLNDQSRNVMSEGKLLNEREDNWQTLSTSNQSETPSAENNSGQNPFATASYGMAAVPIVTFSADAAWNSNNVLPEGPMPAESSGVHPEPSMLERLKEFYGPDGESSARQIWKRNFQKLQSPFSVFRERDKPASSILIQPPLQTESLSDDPASIVVNSASEPNPILIQLIEEVNRELQNWPEQLNGRRQQPIAYQRRQQDLQLLYLISNQPGAAIASLSALPDGEQAFWQELMLAMVQYRTDDDLTLEQQLTATAVQLRSATRHLSVFGDLSFRRLDICSRIHSFGRVEAFPSNDFDPGQPILLYAELDNFSTDITARGSYRTNFDAQLQILHENSTEPIETIDLADISDESTSERTDYFQSFELTVPSHLATGSYRIRVRLRDRISKKTADGFVAFQVR